VRRTRSVIRGFVVLLALAVTACGGTTTTTSPGSEPKPDGGTQGTDKEGGSGRIVRPPVGTDENLIKAAAQATALTTAVKAYHVKHMQYPPALEALAQRQPDGGEPLCKPEALIDPWGKPFQYDPAGPKNGGATPDIWTTRPDGMLLGNWPERS
jgi:hypothetical protein